MTRNPFWLHKTLQQKLCRPKLAENTAKTLFSRDLFGGGVPLSSPFGAMYTGLGAATRRVRRAGAGGINDDTRAMNIEKI